jgi:hypothetical protein
MASPTRVALQVLPLAFVLSCGGPPADPIAFVEKFNALKNRHRIAAALEFLSDDCVLEKPGVMKLEGKAKIAGFYEYQKALQARLVFADYRLAPDEPAGRVTCRAYEQNALQRAAGLPEYVYTTWEYTLAGGRINRIVAIRSEETARAVNDFNVFFQSWLSAHPEAIKKLLGADGKAVYSRETAELIVSLVKEYRSALTIIN